MHIFYAQSDPSVLPLCFILATNTSETKFRDKQ
uniref:Uncharacterized protein n=1 Tax=Anguilla anguilla TaxID=7936 RepID=A0A0E9P927_ANGAN